jgi:PleD family two-component response regulator
LKGLHVARQARAVAANSSLRRPLTISLGVTTLRGEACDADTLIHQAGAALHQAEKPGRNRVCAFVIRS